MTLNRSLFARVLSAALLALPSAAAAQDGSTLTGFWTVSIASPIGVSPARMALTDDSGRLAGILLSERGPTSIEGTRTADGVLLRYSVMHEGAPLPIEMKAPSAGEALEGSVDFGGLAEGTWKASKAESSGVSGAWKFSADDGSGAPTTGTLTLIDDNGTVTGRLLAPSRGVQGLVKGTHKDGALALTVDATADGAPITVVMPGSVDGQSLTGTFTVADLAGRWTATRP